MSFIFGIGYGSRFNCLFRFLKSLRKLNCSDLGLGCAKYGDTHSESFATSRIPNRTKRSTPFLKMSSCTYCTGYDCKYIGFSSSFDPKYTGSVPQFPSIPSKNSLNLCHNFSNSLCCVIVKC